MPGASTSHDQRVLETMLLTSGASTEMQSLGNTENEVTVSAHETQTSQRSPRPGRDERQD